MSKGTPSFGKRNKTVHIRCRRCGRHTYHKKKEKCSACGYPDSRIRKYRWQNKTITRERKK